MTRSTDMLLSILGYNTLHFPKYFAGCNLMEAVRGFENEPERVVDKLTPVIADRDAISDVPIPGLYRELAHRWPGSRFILVSRDPWKWAQSVRNHLKQRALSPFNQIQYRLYLKLTHNHLSEIDDSDLASVHTRHTEAVQTFFENELKEADRLCVASMDKGEVGEHICRFLGHPPQSLPTLTGRSSEQELSALKTWVSVRPDKADAHYLLASNYIHQNELVKAQKHLEQAVVSEPDQPKPYVLLSEILKKQGDSVAVADAAENALRNGECKPWLFYRAAKARLLSGSPIQAIDLWTKGIWRRLKRC